MILDFHTHCFPAALAARAIEKLSDASGTPPYTDGTEDGLRLSMRQAGIDRSVILPVATKPESCARINDGVLRAQGDGAMLYFGALHPDCSCWREELNRLTEGGVPGIKLHPIYQGVDFDDLRTLRILERAGELGRIVVTHAGDDIGFPGESRCAPERIAAALRQVGPVRLVAAHMGGWENWERTELLAEFANVFLDTSFSLGPLPTRADRRFHGQPLGLLDGGTFLRLVRRFGTERILFGTDSPWSSQAQSLARIRSLPFSEQELSAILGGNALRLLGETTKTFLEM